MSESLRRDTIVTAVLLPALLLALAGGRWAPGTGPAAVAPPAGALDVGTLRREPPSTAEPGKAPEASKAADPKSWPKEEEKIETEGKTQAKAKPDAAPGRGPHSAGKVGPDLDPAAAPPQALIDRPAPTQVEEAPRPAAELDRDEVRALVGKYMGWCKEGKIELVLDLRNVAPAQLDTLVESYIVALPEFRVRLQPGGRGAPDASEAPGAGASPSSSLRGDLDRGRWPAAVAAAAREFFAGRADQAKASFILTDRATLMVYRALADAAGAAPKPGGRYRLGLVVDPDTRRPTIQVVGPRE